MVANAKSMTFAKRGLGLSFLVLALTCHRQWAGVNSSLELSWCPVTYGICIPDLFTHMIWAYFVYLYFQHTKIINTVMNISAHVLPFVCSPVQNMPSSGFSVACV